MLDTAHVEPLSLSMNDVSKTSTQPNARRRSSLARLGLRSKITLPYVILAVLLSLAGAYVVTRLITDSLQERFTNQLTESGRLVADEMVAVERENLATLRAVAHTVGVAEALRERDAGALQRLILPISANQGAEYVAVIAADGATALSLHRRAGQGALDDYVSRQGGDTFRDWSTLQRVLDGAGDALGDKYAALLPTPEGVMFYVVGPIWDAGEVVGAVAVGQSVETLVVRMRQASAAHTTLFDDRGRVMASTLYAAGEERPISRRFWERVIAEQEQAIYPRDVEVRGREYTEVFGPLEARGGEDLAVFSAALPRNFLVQASPFTQLQLVVFIAAALVGVVLVGAIVARRITQPLLRVVWASRAVASGDLEQQVEVITQDEVGILAESFNEMVEGLRRGQFIRDAFGRAVSPEVLEELLAGGLELGGETRQVTVLFSDIRGFTSLSESSEPQVVVQWLNEYLGLMTAAVGAHGGVVNKFVGDAVVAIFGAPQHQSDHADRAVRAALEMKQRLVGLNQLRAQRGERPLHNGIGLSTGPVVAGIIGSEERWEYTVIGDVVNVASRLEGLTKQFSAYTLLATAETVAALEAHDGLAIEDLGDIQVKGRVQPVRVFGVRPEAAQ
jgi:adenylate cyclase